MQLQFLKDGPMATFATVQTTKGTAPPELTELWDRFQANEIDAQDFASAIKAMEKGQPIIDFLKP